MLKFLASVYLEDIEFPSNFSHDDNDRLFKLLELSYREMVLFEKQSSPESERYIYRGIVPFLRSIFEHHVSVDTTMQGSLFDLCPRIVEITLALLPGALPQQDYLQNMLSCLDSMLNVAGFKPAQVEPQVLLSTIKDALFVLDQHYGIGNAAMIPFDEINEEFQVYFEKTFMGDDVKKLQQEEFEKLCKSPFNRFLSFSPFSLFPSPPPPKTRLPFQFTGKQHR
jgi:hypothetical protein